MSSYRSPRWSYTSCAILLVVLVAVDATAQTPTFARDDSPSNTGGRGIATADFDRNGSIDIAQANLGRNTVTILLNHPGAGFEKAPEVPVAAGPFDITTSDFNRDGIPDLAVACADGNAISVLLGNGRGSFTRTDVAAPSQNPRGITSADVNNDGKPDLIYTGWASSTVQVLVGNGQGAFTKGVTYVGAPANPQGLATADFNHDGRLDVALAYASSGGLRILYGNGTSFSGRTIVGATNLNVVAAGDFNADGWADVAAASTSNSTVSIYLGSATGLVHTETSATGASPRGISVGDVNQDGVPDLMTANRSSSTVTVLLGDRAHPGEFLPGVEVGAGTGSRAVAAADFNADGKLDLATANEYASSTTVLSNDTIFTRAAYSFSRRTLASAGDHFSQFGMHVWTADFNRDGKLDVLTARTLQDDEPMTVSVILTGGATVTLPVVGYPNGVDVADANADGNPDIVYSSVAGSDAFVTTFLGDGRGGFKASAASATAGIFTYGMIVGDLNRDARPDAVVFGFDESGNGVMRALLGKGDGTFTPGAAVFEDLTPTIAIADINRDAKPDLLALVNGTLRFWVGDGAGNFSPLAETIQLPDANEHFKVADVSGDGYVDLVIVGATGLDIALGSAAGFGALMHTPPVAMCGPTWGVSCWVSLNAFVLADIDRDGHLDIVIAGGEVVHGHGDGTFGPADSFEYDAVDLAVSDLTGDGLPDIVYVTSLGEVGMMVNERNGINRVPSVSAGPDRTLEYQNLTFLEGDRPCFTILAIGTDPDLHRLSYEWRNGSGTIVGQFADYQFCAVPGVYEFSVSAADNRGGTAHDSVVLKVAPTREIVLHVADRAEFSGNWAAVPDASAASGLRAHDTNLGAPKVTAPIPYPDSVVVVTFVADPTQVYKLWVRLKADSNSWSNDSLWIQFSGAADVGGAPRYQIGSTSGLAVNLEECSNCGVSGWGWEDDGWGALNKNGVLLRFPSGGEQSLWIQTREDGVSVDQIVLSAEKYLTTRPGTAKNDRTILPATFPRK